MADKKISKQKKIPQSATARLGRLLGASTRMISREVVGRVSRQLKKVKEGENPRLTLYVKQAEDLVSTLGNLKGAAMKAGQLLSLEMSDLLPEEVTSKLRELHDSANSMGLEEVERILRKELGHLLREKITNLSPEPIACASIGQVHKAQFRGQDIVIKVQFPGVEKTIGSDLLILRNLTKTVMKVSGRAWLLDDIFKALNESLRAETDYKREAKSIEAYGLAFADRDEYIVPDVFEEISTRRILAMSHICGIRLSEYLPTLTQEDQRAYFAKLILDLLIFEFFKCGLVQTDPNYGNFLMNTQTRVPRLVLLDFGATNKYGKDFRKNVRRILLAAYDRDTKSVIEQAREMELLGLKETDEAQVAFVELMENIVQIFRPECQPFAFADESYLKTMRHSSLSFASKARNTTPARQMIFLNRKLGGMYHLLKDARCQVDLHDYWQQLMDMDLS